MSTRHRLARPSLLVVPAAVVLGLLSPPTLIARASVVTTTATVGASPSSTTFGQTVTITATVAPTTGSVMPTGTVTFADGSTTLGSAPLQNGQATWTTSTLAVGQHSLTASYGGDSGDAASTSSAVTATVSQAPVTVTMFSWTYPSEPSQHVEFEAVVVTDPNLPVATGSVTFEDDGTPVGTGTVDSDGIALLNAVPPAGQPYQPGWTAVYSGDADYLGATSAPWIQDTADMNPNERFVAQLYNDVLGRQWDQGGGYYASSLGWGQITTSQIAADLVDSTEYIEDQIEAAYLAHLGRDADTEGLNYWLGYIRSGATYEDLEISFLGTPEYYANAGGTPDDFLTVLYYDVFGRDVDPAGRSYWDARMASGTPSWVVAASVVKSTEAMQNRVTEVYLQMLWRLPDANGLAYWTAKLQAGARDESLIVYLAGSAEYWQKTQAS